MKHACKKIIALLLAVVMIIGVLPFASAGQVGPFVDVPDNKWYSEAIEYVYEYLYMNGITKTTFEPDSTCTRAMAATVLYRVEGEPTVSEKATFSDLTAKWYQNSVAWAEDTGVVNGVGNGKFDPDGLVSRQQLVTMIWRYDGSKEPADDTAINSFPDAANVGKYAVKAFNWAINKGIINGKGGKLDPTGNATRAEFAKIIYTYLLSKAPCADDKHEWIDGEVTKEATCTEAGEMIIICSKCETKSTKEIPALGHDFVDGICSRCGEKLAEEGTAVIYFTNDVHTYIDGDLSYDTVAELKAQTSKLLGGNTLLVDAGDHAQGTAFGSMDKGQTIIELMNAAGYDYATLGNHEFDYGMDGAMNLIKWADYKYLSANFYNEKDGVRGENVLDAYTIVELLGKKVALIGITTPETFTKSTPAYFQNEAGEYIYGIAGGTDGAALYADVQAAIDAAKAEGAEIIIGLGHLGTDVASKPWTSEEVIANTTGLDAFIDGHSHSTLAGIEVADKDGNKVILASTGEYFDSIGKMTIDAEGKISVELITDCALSDESVAADKQAWISEVNEKLGVVIGHADVTFDNYVDDNRIVRKQETNTGDFAADALYYLFDVTEGLEVDLAIMNGGGVRNKAITGDISYLTCKEIHTFGNVACLQTVTGQQILDALEWGARDAGVAECGGFLHVSGVTYEIHTYIPSTVQKDEKGVWTGAPTGEYRVKNVMIGGQPLDLNATYNMAGYNYTLRDLGDGFAMFEGAVNVKDYVMEDYMVLANYVKSFPVDATSGLPTITAENSPYGKVTGEGRITQIAEEPKEDKYVAIYNPANGKAMTTTASSYTNSNTGVTKQQLKAASATVNAEGKLETAAKDIALFKMVTTNGITTFVTADGKYLYCDGTNIGLTTTADENTEFVLEDVSGGQYIRLANYLHEGQFAQYVEYYKDVFTCFGIGSSADVNLYIFNFLEVAEGGSADKEYTLTSELKDGDKVVMYNAGNGKALSSDMNGYNAAGVEIAPDGKVIKTSDATIVWTATKNADGTFTFSQGSKKLMTAFDGTYTNIYFEGDYADTWNVKTANAAKDSYYIYSATEQGSYGDIYLEWYEKKAGFTAYSTSSPSEANYGFQFYTIGGDGGNGTGGDTGETKVFEKVTSDMGDWSGSYVIGWDDGSNAFIFDGINDANENHTASALTDNKVTAPSSSIIEIVAVDGGYTLKAAAGYLNGVEAANKLVFETAPVTATIAWNGSNPIITSAVGTIFRFNNNTYDDGTTYSWFRFFKPASSVQTPINLYKLTDATITPPPTCNHVWDDGVETIEPECETEGLCIFTCTLCGETKEEKIPALGHIDEDNDNLCDDCGKDLTTSGGEGGYVKVTENLNDFSGEYLLVYEESALAFDGSLTTLDTKLACLPVEIVDGVISGDYSANIITIASMGDGKYSIQAASGIYFSHSGTSNTLNNATSPAAMSISIEDGNAIIIAEDDYILRFNSTADQMRFRFYKQSSSVQTPVALYKFSGETGTVTPPPTCEHVWDDGVETVEPECETEGLCIFTCTICGETKEVVLEALGHIDEDFDNLCDDCNKDLSESEEGFTLAASIKDGDQVVIYNAGNGMAVPAEMLGSYYLAGVAVTAENDTIVTEDERIIWTVIDNGDGTFSFSNGDSILSINWNTSTSKTSMSLDGANPKMTVESCNPANHSYYIYSATQEGNYGPIFLEWYAKYTEFSAYSTSFDRVNEAAFGFQFFVRGAEGVCAHVWDDGEVTLEPTCQADGEITYNCTKCEEVKNEVIPALDCADADGDNKCDTCGATIGGELEQVTFADLKDGDTIMIVVHTAADMTNKDYVLLSNFGSTPANNIKVFDGEHDTTMYWTVSIIDGVVRFCANGSADYLYSISTSNNGLRVGKDDAGVMGYDATMGYLTTTDNAGNVRYIGVYDNNKGDVSAVPNPNFRGYKLASDGTLSNIGNQTTIIYKIG